MTRAMRIIVIGGVLLLLVAVAAGIVLQWRYGLILPGPRISHAEVASERTALRMGFNPSLAQEAIEAHYSGSLPSWALSLGLPYEIAAFCDPDVTASSAGVAVFVNPRRGSPLLAERVNEAGVLARALDIEWEPEGLHRAGRGYLLAEGMMPINPEGVALLRENWGIVAPMSPLTLEGGHCLELVLDMRDGRGFLILSEFVGFEQPPEAMTHPSNIVHLLYKLSEMRLFADVVSPNEVSAVLRLELRPNLTEGDAKSLSFLLNTIMSRQAPRLRSSLGLEIKGASKAEDLTVVGEYAIIGIDRLLKGAGQQPGTFTPPPVGTERDMP